MYGTHMRVVYHFCCCQSHSSGKLSDLFQINLSEHTIDNYTKLSVMAVTTNPRTGTLPGQDCYFYYYSRLVLC